MEDSKQLVKLRRENRFFDLMPTHIVKTLCDNLSIKDQFRFARVCKSIHTSVFERVHPQALKETPWLIGLTDNSTSLCETIYNNQVTCYQIGTKPFKYSQPNILGYSKGWLYVHYSCNYLIQLVNIFINVCLDLPSLSTIVRPKSKNQSLHAQAFALSLCIYMRPVMIAIVDQYGNLALCKTNGGSPWKAHEHHRQDEGYYVNVAFNYEKLYAMRKKEFHTFDIFNVRHYDLTLFPMRVIEYKNVINLSLLNSVQQAYLVEDYKRKNIFVVMEYQCMFGKAFEFDVFKVENDGDEFVRVKNLGDQIILLSDSYNEIIDVKDCPGSDIFKGNQICFKGSFYHDVGIYSLKDGTVIWDYPNSGLQCRQWICPRFITTSECDCELHW